MPDQTPHRVPPGSMKGFRQVPDGPGHEAETDLVVLLDAVRGRSHEAQRRKGGPEVAQPLLLRDMALETITGLSDDLLVNLPLAAA